jgi:hypothetical protein
MPKHLAVPWKMNPDHAGQAIAMNFRNLTTVQHPASYPENE